MMFSDSDHKFQIGDKNRYVLLAMIAIPMLLLVLGVFEGLLQTLYRAGYIRATSFWGIEYYQGLTLHGVINAIVFTTFFDVAFGFVIVAYYLRKPVPTIWLVISFAVMLIGTLMAAFPMLTGTASVLYTFYPPLKANPLFYIGAALLIVGSWIGFFSWIPQYLSWRKENPGHKTPLAVVGILAAFTIWFFCTLPVAYEVLVLLVPWSLGWTSSIDVVLARTLFWFFGHPLVYFWLLPTYVMFYVMLPKIAGGKLYSDGAGRMAFMLFLVLSSPVGLHHQFSDPGISSAFKWFHMIMTLAVAIPSFMTAFTVAASLENAGLNRGGTGLFGWWKKLPYLDQNRWMFSYLFCGLVLFFFGGITGIINASGNMNLTVHNTAWIPAHFHTTVAGPVFLSYLGMSLLMISQFRGTRIAFPKFNVWVPWLWLIGVSIFSTGLSVSGVLGEPRRTNLGLTYANPESARYVAEWHVWDVMGAIGGVIMFVSTAIFFIIFFTTLFRKTVALKGEVQFPTSEAYHDERLPKFENFKPWVVAMILAVLLAYIPPLYQITSGKQQKAIPYRPWSPAPEVKK
jgi:cytochrome c oxidase subunit 1